MEEDSSFSSTRRVWTLQRGNGGGRMVVEGRGTEEVTVFSLALSFSSSPSSSTSLSSFSYFLIPSLSPPFTFSHHSFLLSPLPPSTLSLALPSSSFCSLSPISSLSMQTEEPQIQSILLSSPPLPLPLSLPAPHTLPQLPEVPAGSVSGVLRLRNTLSSLLETT